jgi:hypothetical protein
VRHTISRLAQSQSRRGRGCNQPLGSGEARMPERRTTAKLIRFHAEGLAGITAAARACGQTPARYIRETALRAWRVVVPRDPRLGQAHRCRWQRRIANGGERARSTNCGSGSGRPTGCCGGSFRGQWATSSRGTLGAARKCALDDTLGFRRAATSCCRRRGHPLRVHKARLRARNTRRAIVISLSTMAVH